MGFAVTGGLPRAPDEFFQQIIPTPRVSAFSVLFSAVAEGFSGKGGPGSLESLCEAPRTPSEGHDLQFHKYCSVYIRFCSSPPPQIQFLVFFQGIQNTGAEKTDLFLHQIVDFQGFFFSFCVTILNYFKTLPWNPESCHCWGQGVSLGIHRL